MDTCVGLLKNGKVELRSRNNLSFNEKFDVIVEALGQWKINALLMEKLLQ